MSWISSVKGTIGWGTRIVGLRNRLREEFLMTRFGADAANLPRFHFEVKSQLNVSLIQVGSLRSIQQAQSRTVI